MTKKKWHIALVQETGVISKTDPNLHVSIKRAMCNHVFFNSPHHAHLKEKQYKAKMLELTHEHDEGTLDTNQFHTQLLLALGHWVYLSGGLAIMVNHDILNKVQTHCISYMSKHGHVRRSKCLMAVSLSVNGVMTCVINGYAPVWGSSIVSDWITKSVLPAVWECQLHKWNMIIGGNFNTTPFPIDCRNPSLYKECRALIHLLSARGGLVNSFRSVNPAILQTATPEVNSSLELAQCWLVMGIRLEKAGSKWSAMPWPAQPQKSCH
jgi:hypothetical protein